MARKDPRTPAERRPIHVRIQVGSYRFEIDEATFRQWERAVQNEVGFAPGAVTTEIRRRLGL